MRADNQNTSPQVDRSQERQTLKFFFTPADTPKPGRTNPHEKQTTWVPEVVEALRAQFGEAVGRVEEYAGEQTVYVAKERIVDVCTFLKEEHAFVYLSDLGGIDRFTDEERYEVYYNLISFEKRKRIRLKVRVDEDDPVLPTLVPVYRAAGWNERECYDMLGLRFEGHPDMRRMYMPEDFEHYPLRKEFPPLGIPGSLPLPPRTPEGELTTDPFAAAHEGQTVKSYEEPRSSLDEEED